MADPLSTSGLALSAVSLVFQIFSRCIKGYQLLTKAQGLPKKYDYLRVRLQLEQCRLLDWAAVAELSETNNAILGPRQLGQSTALDALRQMETLLLDLGNLSTKFSLTLAECADEKSDIVGGSSTGVQLLQAKQQVLRQKTLEFIARSKSYPKRLSWVVFNGDKFELLLSNVTAVNDSMLYFLNTHQKRRHHEVQNRIDDLMQLVQSFGSPSTGPSARTTVDQRYAELTRFKLLTLTIEDNTTSSSATALIDSDPEPPGLRQLALAPEELYSGHIDASNLTPFRSQGTYKGQDVWAEWRYYAPIPSGSAHAYLEDRISRLALLLKQGGSHAEFSIPKCLGYIHQPQALRIGLIFKALNGSSTGAVPISLNHLMATIPKPSLTIRIQLANTIATSLWYLHATNWVHKGVRSDNILFQVEGDLSYPLLSGFDYARPSEPGEVTDLGVENRVHELYRHPDVQFDVPRDGRHGFKKLHDVYSLGVVLFEIGLWKSVDTYLGVPPHGLSEISRPQVKEVQSRLLSSDAKFALSAETGDMFTRSVRFCLDSDMARSGGFSTYAIDEASLQSEFEEQVLRRLRNINV